MCVVASFLIGDNNLHCSFPVWLEQGPRYELQGMGGTWGVIPTQVLLSTPVVHTRTGLWITAGFLSLAAYGIGLLRSVFRSLRSGSPFVAANARRLHRMGLTVLAIEALRILVTTTLIAPEMKALDSVEGQGWRVDVGPSWTIVFVACVFLILAEVFRRGTEMQDEQELTV